MLVKKMKSSKYRQFHIVMIVVHTKNGLMYIQYRFNQTDFNPNGYKNKLTIIYIVEPPRISYSSEN